MTVRTAAGLASIAALAAVAAAAGTAALPPAALDAAATAPGVEAVAVVRSGHADLVASAGADGIPVDAVADGFAIPLDIAAVDPGGRIEVAGGTTLAVVAVVPDTSVGAAEVVVDAATGAALGVDTPRAALIAHAGDRAAIEAAVVGAATGTPLRFRAPGETPYLRAADAVLPQALVKAAFGEFAYRPAGGDAVVPDPDWVATAVVDAEAPVLGAVRCHRAVVEPLTEAMAAIEAEGLGDELAASGFDGCFVPRFLRSGSTLSRHSWGIAFDVGFGANPTNATSAQQSASSSCWPKRASPGAARGSSPTPPTSRWSGSVEEPDRRPGSASGPGDDGPGAQPRRMNGQAPLTAPLSAAATTGFTTSPSRVLSPPASVASRRIASSTPWTARATT